MEQLCEPEESLEVKMRVGLAVIVYVALSELHVVWVSLEEWRQLVNSGSVKAFGAVVKTSMQGFNSCSVRQGNLESSGWICDLTSNCLIDGALIHCLSTEKLTECSLSSLDIQQDIDNLAKAFSKVVSDIVQVGC